MVRSIENDEDDQPDGNDAQAENQKPLEKACKQSQDFFISSSVVVTSHRLADLGAIPTTEQT